MKQSYLVLYMWQLSIERHDGASNATVRVKFEVIIAIDRKRLCLLTTQTEEFISATTTHLRHYEIQPAPYTHFQNRKKEREKQGSWKYFPINQKPSYMTQQSDLNVLCTTFTQGLPLIVGTLVPATKNGLMLNVFHICDTMFGIRCLGVGECQSEDPFVCFGAKPTQRACAQDTPRDQEKTR